MTTAARCAGMLAASAWTEEPVLTSRKPAAGCPILRSSSSLSPHEGSPSIFNVFVCFGGEECSARRRNSLVRRLLISSPHGRHAAINDPSFQGNIVAIVAGAAPVPAAGCTKVCRSNTTRTRLLSSPIFYSCFYLSCHAWADCPQADPELMPTQLCTEWKSGRDPLEEGSYSLAELTSTRK